ncbi:hypothetical protein Hanom_Chr12g01159651 [Helianthus anomalus]
MYLMHMCIHNITNVIYCDDYNTTIFETSHGLTTRAYLINTSENGQWISQNVIECWAAILNYEEKKKTIHQGKAFMVLYDNYRKCFIIHV